MQKKQSLIHFDINFACIGHAQDLDKVLIIMLFIIQVNLDKTDSMGPGKLVRHMQNLSYTYDKYLISIGLRPSISSVICKNPSYSGPSYPSSPVSSYGLSHCHSCI